MNLHLWSLHLGSLHPGLGMGGLLPMVLVGAATALLPAQLVPPQGPVLPPQGPVSPSGSAPSTRNDPMPATPPGRPIGHLLQGLTPVWVELPPGKTFQGFPVFPQRLTGYGGYPLPGDVPDPLRPVPLLLPSEPEPVGWPRWARMKDKQPLPYAENLALLVRHGDRVWWRSVDEDAFVPLFFHDPFTTLGAGAQVEVRQSGEFELLLHESTRIVAQGPTALRLAAMDQATVTVEVQTLTRLRMQVSHRDHTIVLPDGSKLRIPPPAAGGETAGPALVFLLRADEPGWLGGRASVFNAGQRPVLRQHAFGESALEPGQRVTFFLEPPTHPIPANVIAEGITMQADGHALQGTAAGPAQVSWCGARFALPASTSLRLDPLQGRPFAAPSVTTAPDKAP